MDSFGRCWRTEAPEARAPRNLYFQVYRAWGIVEAGLVQHLMRVLIATATAGAGHLAAAAALEEAWRAFRPEDALKKLDLVEFFSPLHRKLHADGYVKLVEHA